MRSKVAPRLQLKVDTRHAINVLHKKVPHLTFGSAQRGDFQMNPDSDLPEQLITKNVAGWNPLDQLRAERRPRAFATSQVVLVERLEEPREPVTS